LYPQYISPISCRALVILRIAPQFFGNQNDLTAGKAGCRRISASTKTETQKYAEENTK
jgi:hypothetical protein